MSWRRFASLFLFICLLTSFPVRHLVWSSSVTTPQHFSNSTSRSVAGAVIFLGGPVVLLSQQFTGSLALAMHSALPSDVHSLCLVACVPWTTLPLALQTLPVSSGTWSHWCASALRSLSVPHPGTLAFLWVPLLRPSDIGSLVKPFPAWTATCASGLQPWLLTCMASMSLLTTSSLPWRIRFTHSPSLPPQFVCGGLLVGVTTSPPQAARPAIGLGRPLALSAMMWMVFLFITSPLAPPTSMLFLRRLTVQRTSVCTARLGVQPRRRVEHATDNPGPHSLCRARLRTAPTTLMVMPPSFAHSFCILGIVAPSSFSMVLMWVFQFELASWSAFCGSRAYQGDSRVHVRHLCRGDAEIFRHCVLYVRVYQVRAWRSSNQL